MSKETKSTTSSNRSPLSPLWLVRHEAFLASIARLQEIDLSAYYGRADSLSEAEEAKPYPVQDGVALIHLNGYLTRDPSWWSWIFGGTSSMQTRLQVMQAAEDPDVESILLCVYSPGGEVYGVGDLYGAVIEAKKKKKVWAYIADEGCSAAYWAICGCNRIVCNATAIVGSIGIMSVVEDWSKAYQKAGVKVEVFKSGEHKGAEQPGTSMTEEQRAEKQRLVDAIADQFFGAVEEGRNLEGDALDAVTDGRVFVGQEAREMGLVDDIGTLETVLMRLKPKPAESTNQTRFRYGAATTNPPLAGKQETTAMNWREKLAAALAKRGLHVMAGLVMGAQEDNMEALAQQLHEQVEAEAKTLVASSQSPLLTALEAAEIKTPQALQTLIAEARDGRAASAEMDSVLEAAAVRRFGQGDWKQYTQAYQHLPLATRKAVAEQWEKDADAALGTNPKTSAKRQTAPTALKTEATDADAEKPSVLSKEERGRVRATAERYAGSAGKNGGSH